MKIKKIALPIVIGALASAPLMAGILGSKHDLSDNTPNTTEVCVFCHTPHGSNTGAAAPLWNKTLPSTTYTRYSSLGTATLDGEEVPVGSVSLACLSCHDGTQAMDSVINAPGSGMGTGSIGGVGQMTGTPVPVLGADLSNDHPISIEYAGGSCTGTTGDCTPAASTGDADFQTAQHAVINTKNQWWVDVASYTTDLNGTTTGSGTADVREKTDMILYARTFTGGEGPSVECASCHDPHEDAERPVSFLRISNAQSGVCLACHVK